MKTTFAYILSLTLMLAACSDSKSTRETLSQADRLVNDKPDSALILLEELDSRDADNETQEKPMTQAMISTVPWPTASKPISIAHC